MEPGHVPPELLEALTKRVSDYWERNCRVGEALDHSGLPIIFTPALRFFEGRPAQATPLRNISRELNCKIMGSVVARLVARYNSGLLYEILRNAPTDDDHSRVA